MAMSRYFKNKIVMITGAASGMGLAYAKAFAKAGAHLALNDYDTAGLQQTTNLISTQYKSKVMAHAFDVSNAEAMQHFADQVKQQLGLVDIVINNAGVTNVSLPAWELGLDEYERSMRINFYGVLNGCRAFLPQLLEKGSGHIVNVSSLFGLVGSPNHSAYCASKFAVRGYSEALMTELQESKIKVHLLHPGGIATNICKSVSGAQQFEDKFLATSPDDIAKYLLKHIRRGTARIVYGQDSFKTWLGATVLPLGLLNKAIWSEVRHVVDPEPYRRLKK